MQSEKADLVENIKVGNLKNMRPKTRGEPSNQNLDIKLNEQVTDNYADKGSNFSARRKTHNNTSDSAAGGVNQIRGIANEEAAKQYNATQKSPNLNNAVHFGGRVGQAADHLSSRSPDKTNRGLGVI